MRSGADAKTVAVAAAIVEVIKSPDPGRGSSLDSIDGAAEDEFIRPSCQPKRALNSVGTESVRSVDRQAVIGEGIAEVSTRFGP